MGQGEKVEANGTGKKEAKVKVRSSQEQDQDHLRWLLSPLSHLPKYKLSKLPQQSHPHSFSWGPLDPPHSHRTSFSLDPQNPIGSSFANSFPATGSMPSNTENFNEVLAYPSASANAACPPLLWPARASLSRFA
ncbi:hypothetical protein CFP56_009075 [Quercus suber]|uniref:Uncharacterized protein n=1 Tax=Quercus suber TaxID=58331 RepID=A0AAW0L3Q6_QUESU